MGLKAALVQMKAESDKSRNLHRAEEYVRQAALEGAHIVCLQELFSTIYFPVELDPRYFEFAEPIPGPAVRQMQAVAEECSVVLIAPIYERTSDSRLFNTAAVISSRGDLLGIYRKSSISKIQTPTLYGDEPYYFLPGDTGFTVFETPVARVGILICYDRHFPEAARLLGLRGAQVVFVPTATRGMSRDSWELELRAHAIANNYFVGAVNRVGSDGRELRFPFYGSSFFCDPRGNVIARAGEEEDEILYADLDLTLCDQVRDEWGFYRYRRPDLYGGLSNED